MQTILASLKIGNYIRTLSLRIFINEVFLIMIQYIFLENVVQKSDQNKITF